MTYHDSQNTAKLAVCLKWQLFSISYLQSFQMYCILQTPSFSEKHVISKFSSKNLICIILIMGQSRMDQSLKLFSKAQLITELVQQRKQRSSCVFLFFATLFTPLIWLNL